MADEDETQGQVGGALRGLRPDAGAELLDVLASVRSGLGLVPSAPVQLGRYRMGERLGRGGGGVVFSATDTTLGRPVAVKLVSTREGGEEVRATARLLREARALARLNHPNIVQIFDVGSYDAAELAVADASTAGVYVVMELVEGRDVRAWFDEAPPRAEVLDVMLAAGRGLAAAHAAGVVHRDFKPANVLIGSDGSVKVADFGLARDTAAPWPTHNTTPTLPGSALVGEATRTGDVIGTPAYMAPEQFKGEAGERSDQFAFCLALFEGLTGRRPFGRASPYATLQRKVEGDIRGLHLLPSRLRRPIARGLAANPADRHRSIDALLHALRPRRRWRWPALLGLFGLGLTAAVPLLLGSPGGACDAGHAWSPQRAEAVRTAIEDAAPGASASAATASDVLTDLARDLGEAEAIACNRAEVVRECVADRRTVFEALVDRLLASDAATAEGAVQLVDGLYPASACLTLSERSVPDSKPPPAVAEEVRAVRVELSAIATMLDERRPRDAAAAIADVTQRAEALGFEPLTAEVLGIRGTAALRADRVQDASELLEQSYWMAAGIGRADQMTRTATSLVHLHGVVLKERAPMLKWERHAQTAAARVQRPAMRDALVNARAAARLGLRRYDEAASILEEALPEIEARRGASSVLARMLHNLGIAYSHLERFDEAEAALARAHGIFTARVGPSHPETASAVAQLAILREQQGDLGEAVRLNRQAYDALRSWSDRPHAWMPLVSANLGQNLFDLGRHAEAEVALQRGIDDALTLVGEAHPIMPKLRTHLARAWSRQGRHAEALAVLEELLAAERASATAAVFAAEACAATCEPERAAQAFFRADRMLSEAGDAPAALRVALLEVVAGPWPGGTPPIRAATYAARLLPALDSRAAPAEYHRAAELAARDDERGTDGP